MAGKTLVVYFSATGSTKRVARHYSFKKGKYRNKYS